MNANTLSEPIELPELDVPQPAANRRRPLKLVLGTGIAALAVTAGIHFGRLALFTEVTDNAYITAHVHRVAANIGGPLSEVIADDNEVVKKGQTLARIDPREFEIMEQKASSTLEQVRAGKLQAAANAAEARAAASRAEAMMAVAEADILGGKARVDLARLTLERNESLITVNHAVSQAAVDQSRGDLQTAEAQLAAAKANLEAARANRESSAAAIQAAGADLAAADAEIRVQEAALAETRRQSAFTDILAPASGRIGAKNAEAGNRVQTGQALFALVEDDYWIVANFKETQLEKMAAGQPVEISVDSLGGRHFTGTVASIAPATGAQFALLPPDNATGNFTKVVQRVPVKITFDRDSIRGFEERLRPGLSTTVRVKVR